MQQLQLGAAMLLADALVGLGYVSLARAADAYYRRTRQSKMAQAAEEGNASRDQILNWYGYWLVQQGVPFTGSSPPRKRSKKFQAKKLNQNSVSVMVPRLCTCPGYKHPFLLILLFGGPI